MIRGLARKLEALSAVPQVSAIQKEPVCRVIEEREPLTEYAGLDAVLPRTLAILGASADVDIRSALFVDTETTGLSGGSVAFLIGCGFVQGDSFVTRQLLMRDYDEEGPSLRVFADMLEEAEFLVSFNGKSFDMPLLRTRFTINRLGGRMRELPHIDLLHASRRIWKARLSGCTLRRIEEETLGLHRTDDLPGSLVPRRFFDYLACKDERLLDDIIRHNADDVRGMARIVALLSEIYMSPCVLTNELDALSFARSLTRRAVQLEHREMNPALALACVDIAQQIASDEDAARLARRKTRLTKKL